MTRLQPVQAVYNLPALTPTLDQLGVLMQIEFVQPVKLTASIVGAGAERDDQRDHAVVGVSSHASFHHRPEQHRAEVYGGQYISYISISAGQTITLPCNRKEETPPSSVDPTGRREALVYEEGNSERLLGHFYKLLVVTRKRQHLPPQPLKWFRSLMQASAPALQYELHSRTACPFQHLDFEPQKTVTYKYGCSDAQSHPAGGMALLFWNTISKPRPQVARNSIWAQRQQQRGSDCF